MCLSIIMNMKNLIIRLMLCLILFAAVNDSYAQRGRNRHRSRTSQSRASTTNSNNSQNQKILGWEFLMRQRPESCYGNSFKYLPPSFETMAEMTKDINLPGLSMATYQKDDYSVAYVVFFKNGKPLDSLAVVSLRDMTIEYLHDLLKYHYW